MFWDIQLLICKQYIASEESEKLCGNFAFGALKIIFRRPLLRGWGCAHDAPPPGPGLCTFLFVFVFVFFFFCCLFHALSGLSIQSQRRGSSIGSDHPILLLWLLLTATTMVCAFIVCLYLFRVRAPPRSICCVPTQYFLWGGRGNLCLGARSSLSLSCNCPYSSPIPPPPNTNTPPPPSLPLSLLL